MAQDKILRIDNRYLCISEELDALLADCDSAEEIVHEKAHIMRMVMEKFNNKIKEVIH